MYYQKLYRDLCNMNWISHPVILEGKMVKLVPLESAHFNELIAISRNKKIWEFLTVDGSDENTITTELKSALLKRMDGTEYPFTIIDKKSGKIIGSTRYIDIHPQYRKLEIGWTWNDPDYWGKGHNSECKLLLLTYAFETLKCIRVQLKTSDKNIRSQTAIKKIGGKLEGTLRNERILYNGTKRNSVMFSIIDEEWPEVKNNLIRLTKS
jgi:N-acetyltransferase